MLKDRILPTQFATSTIIRDVPQHARQPLQVALLCFALLCNKITFLSYKVYYVDSSYLIPHSPFKASPTALNVVCASAKAFLFFNIVSSALIQACFRFNSGFILANCSSTMATLLSSQAAGRGLTRSYRQPFLVSLVNANIFDVSVPGP